MVGSPGSNSKSILYRTGSSPFYLGHSDPWGPANQSQPGKPTRWPEYRWFLHSPSSNSLRLSGTEGEVAMKGGESVISPCVNLSHVVGPLSVCLGACRGDFVGGMSLCSQWCNFE